MKANIGGADRGIRIVLGLVLLALGFAHVIVGTAAIIAYVVGAITLLTGLVRFCPAWSVVGINTCAASKTHAK